MNGFPKKYGKALLSLAGAVGIAAWQGWSGDHHMDVKEGAVTAMAFGNALIVWLVPLMPDKPWLKSAAGAIVAGATALGAVALGGLNYDELTVVGIAVLQALGVKFGPAISNNGTEAPAGFADR